MSEYRFSECFADNVKTHGLRWTIKHYAKRMPQWELRFWCRQWAESF